jgi:hypothetical protein
MQNGCNFYCILFSKSTMQSVHHTQVCCPCAYAPRDQDEYWVEIKLLNVSLSITLWWMIQPDHPTALTPVSIEWVSEWELEVVLNLTAKSTYVCQPDIERRPLSDSVVPAYFVQLLIMDSVVRSNVIFCRHIPRGAQWGLTLYTLS